jgi:hypothetical protein
MSDNILHIKNPKLFGDWSDLLDFLKWKGNPEFYLEDAYRVIQFGEDVKDLGNLVEIRGSALFLKCPITDLGNLRSVTGDVTMLSTSVTELYTEQEIRNKVQIGGRFMFANDKDYVKKNDYFYLFM